MKISKALKLKNRLAGEIAHLRQQIQVNNVTENDNTAPLDVRDLMDEMNQKQVLLVSLKTKIDVANAPIWGKIVEMGELKARITWLRSIPTREGTFQTGMAFRASEPVKTTYHAVVKQADVEEEVKKLTERIDSLQDDVDAFNATTELPNDTTTVYPK